MLVWDNDRRHLGTVMRAAIEARPWLTVFQLSAYAPELNHKLKRTKYRHGLLDGFVAQTGLILEPP
ncbi:hypothetical protein [Streptosporangium roseum]|uniref:hypothetical protein n=1 Tax=Streptosporangium roseum TaxID=2001 RepID=UPI0002FE9167|nr:hypothetical protein [Streptosporangium roseum]